MPEYWKQSYSKEEEFLDEFYGAASEAAQLLGGDWVPNPACSDKARHNRDYFLPRGELDKLTFDSAAVYHDEKGFSSVQIILKSSNRTVNIRVRKVNDSFVAEKILDRNERKD
jgi:hypothetical protein